MTSTSISTHVAASVVSPGHHSSNARLDGRGANDIRPLFINLGVNLNASGSAWVEIGNTKVMAAVFGPKENQRVTGDTVATGILECTVQHAPFLRKVRQNQGQGLFEQERRACSTLEQALLPVLMLDRFPKSVLECTALVLEDDGSESCAVLLASVLAVADAGVDMLDLPVMMSVAGMRAPDGSGWTLWADPTQAEEECAAFVSSVAYSPALQTLASVQHRGSAPSAVLTSALSLAMEAAVAVGQQARVALLKAGQAKKVASAGKAGEVSMT